jgi:Lysylphosphatidylglycerol synthase TM region
VVIFTAMQLNKNIKIFINYFLGPLLFVWLAYSIYHQITRQPQLKESWLKIIQSFHTTKVLYLAAASLLIPVNWGLEALKWKRSLRQTVSIGFWPSFKAVLSGVSFSVTMPNRVGEYLGRMVYLPEGNRLKTISITLVGSFAQLLITLMAGTIGLFFLDKELRVHFPDYGNWSALVRYGTLLVAGLLALIYFQVSALVGFFRKWIRSEKYLYLVSSLRHFKAPLLLHLLFLSLMRYLVFLLQYILLFYLFGVDVSPEKIALVMSIVFLVMAAIPSIALLEVWLRGETIILLLSIFSPNVLGIGFTSVTIWCMNLVLPAIAGSLLLLNLRVFRKKNPVDERHA